jgi:hypothetical protein
MIQEQWYSEEMPESYSWGRLLKLTANQEGRTRAKFDVV